MRKTTEQERASFCIEEVKKVKSQLEEKDKDKFERNAMRFSQLIVSNGLIPTLAFYKKGEREPVYKVLNRWLVEIKKYVSNDALEELVNADVSKLRLVTMEALALANWLKRIVEVEIKG